MFVDNVLLLWQFWADDVDVSGVVADAATVWYVASWVTTNTSPRIASHVTSINIHTALAYLLSQIGSGLRSWGTCHAHRTIAASLRTDLIIHRDWCLLKVPRALLKMITILRSIHWSIATLPLRIQSRARYLFTHPHLLRVWKFILQLVLLVRIASLTRALIRRGHICDADGIGRFWAYSVATRILDATLYALVVDIGSWIQRTLHIGGLHHLLARASPALARSHGWHSKGARLRHTVCLHILHLLGLRWIRYSATLASYVGATSSSHLGKRIITTVPLTFGLIRRSRSKSTPCSLGLWVLRQALWIHRNIPGAIHVGARLYVVYLNVVVAIVEVAYIQGQTVLVDLLVDLYLILDILNAAWWNLSLRHLPRHRGSHTRSIWAVRLPYTRVVTLHLLLLGHSAATTGVGADEVRSSMTLTIFKILHVYINCCDIFLCSFKTKFKL